MLLNLYSKIILKKMKIIIHGELTNLNTYINNERGNKFNAARIKRDETTKCAYYFMGKGCCEKRYFISFVWFLKDKRKDPDNIAFAKKFILDGMVRAKFIKTDSLKHIAGFSDNFFIDKKNPRVEIGIIPV